MIDLFLALCERSEDMIERTCCASRGLVLIALTALGCTPSVAVGQPGGTLAERVVEKIKLINFDCPQANAQVAAELEQLQREADVGQVLRDLLYIYATDDRPNTRIAVLWCVTSFGERARDIVPFLMDNAKNTSLHPRVRIHAMTALVSARPAWDKQLDFLGAALDDDVLQYMAIDVIKQLGPAAAPLVPALIEKMKKSEGALFIEVLGGVGPAAEYAVPHLLRRLTYDPMSYVRAASVEALAKIAGQRQRVRRVLESALLDEDSKVRDAAARALGVDSANK